MEEITLKIEGTPIAQPRHRRAQSGHFYIPAAHPIHKWKELIRLISQSEVKEPTDGYVSLSLEFILPRPKSIPDSQLYSKRKPDLDNLIKAVLDALNGVVYEDDRQVYHIEAHKIYEDKINTPGLKIKLSIKK